MRTLAALATICLLATAALAQGAAETPLPSVELPPEMARVLQDYETAWKTHDAAKLAELFAEDGFVLANGKLPVRGRAAIRQAYAESGGPLALRALAFASEGNTGYIIGGYGPGGDQPDSGKFVLALKRAKDGRWLITADIDNGNRRPARPPAAPPPAPPG